MDKSEGEGGLAVIFDIGNVLLRFDYLQAANRLVAMNGLAAMPDREPIVAAKEALEGGEIDRAEFLRRVKPAFNHLGSDEDFLTAWQDIFEENLPMTSLATEIAGMGIPTYLLSNISCIHVDYITKRYPVFSDFRDAVFSYRVGALKPSPRIYEVAVSQFRIDPSRTLFIDDLPQNVAAAKAVGLHALEYRWQDHQSAETVIRQFLRIGDRDGVDPGVPTDGGRLESASSA